MVATSSSHGDTRHAATSESTSVTTKDVTAAPLALEATDRSVLAAIPLPRPAPGLSKTHQSGRLRGQV